MTAEIVATQELTSIHGVKVRVWRGQDQEYRHCIFYVARVAYPEGIGRVGVPDLEEIIPPAALADVAARSFI